MPTDFLSMNDISDGELQTLLNWGDSYRSRSENSQPLAGQSVVLLFEKPSLRTKLSFDIGVYELGGHAIYMGGNEVDLDAREPVEDVAAVIERWVVAIVARVNNHSTLERLAARANVPVINALSDVEHPCQAVADLATVRQKLGKLDGLKMAYIGDANNCALSFGIGCAAVGSQFTIASPNGYAFDSAAVSAISSRGATPLLTDDPREAIADADVVYTDAWTSMGQEAEAAERRQAFQGFQVNDALLAFAKPGALVMHPMPVHYGEEMPAGMLDHPQSVAFDQAENRLHAQKAVLRLVTVGE
ncbi:MAG: ornithine carbamoyltransferase [Chloroflexi bacterium]|nr:ornithine carbamoyltransferase [Chloroflexota bacterium]